MRRPISHAAITFTKSSAVPRPFRGRTLTDSSTKQALPGTYDEWGLVLATVPGGRVWIARADDQFVAASWPEELGVRRNAPEQLTAGRFMGLCRSRTSCASSRSRRRGSSPESKACFVFDDPNLHWWSYGYLDYRELAAHAEAHDYRVTAATIPLDQWYIHRATARSSRGRISRLVRGSWQQPHTARAWPSRRSDRASTLAAQALSDPARFGERERRSVPSWFPRTAPVRWRCSRAACVRGSSDLRRMALLVASEADASTPLSGWQPLDRIAGLPVIPRLHVVASDRTTCPSAHSSASRWFSMPITRI